MRIKKLSYTSPSWKLENLQLSEINLIVGKNATGKTRTCSTISTLARIINLKPEFNWEEKWEVIFENSSYTIEYKFSTTANGIKKEQLYLSFMKMKY